MNKTTFTRSSGFWQVVCAAALWGTIGVATQAIYALDSTTSLFINLGRLVVATPLLLLICWRVLGRQMFVVRGRDLGLMLLSGTLLAGSHAAYFASIRYAGVTTATLLTICVAPLVVAALSVMFRAEHLSRRLLLALGFALAGSVLLVGLQGIDGAQEGLLPGAAFALAAAVTYACAVFGGRVLAAHYHPLQVTAFNFSAGAVALLVVNLAVGIVPTQTAQGWLLLLYLGLVPTALAYWLFQMGLRTVPATAASIISMLDPLVAALLAWALFGETLTPGGIAGAALLLSSIFVLRK
jgi:DME family drug/metabolite transporter